MQWEEKENHFFPNQIDLRHCSNFGTLRQKEKGNEHDKCYFVGGRTGRTGDRYSPRAITNFLILTSRRVASPPTGTTLIIR